MEGSKRLYLLAMVAIIFAQIVVIIFPLIISATIDSIIEELPINNNFLVRMVSLPKLLLKN